MSTNLERKLTMFLRFESLRELNFRALMEVYEEGNRENAADRYPEEPEFRGLALVEEDFRQYLRDSFFAVHGAAYFVWAENGRYISALRLEPYQDGLLLEALETRPDMRRKGYAARLIRSVVEILPEGTKVYSHVSKRNTTSLKTHESCGFEKILNYAVYVDGSVLHKACTLRIVIKNQ